MRYNLGIRLNSDRVEFLGDLEKVGSGKRIVRLFFTSRDIGIF
jgi:hypothetical protein